MRNVLALIRAPTLLVPQSIGHSPVKYESDRTGDIEKDLPSMTTTLHPPAELGAAPAANHDKASTHERAGLRIRGRHVVAFAVLACVAAAAWYAVATFTTKIGSTDPTVYLVTKRSFPVTIEAKGELKAKNTIDVKCKVEGRSTILTVIEEGVTVKKGDLLITLASDEIDERVRQEEANEASAIAASEAAIKDLEILIDQNKSDIRKAKLKVELAEIERKKYLEGDRKKDLMDAKLEIDRTEQMHKRAKLDYDAAVTLRSQNFITESELLQDEYDLHEAERGLEKAKLTLTILTEYTIPKELRQRESDVDEARKDLERVKKSALAREAQKKADVEAKRSKLLNTQSKLKKYRGQKENTEIRAPSPGLVVYDTGHRWDPRKISEGSEVYEGQTIVTLPDPSVMTVSVRIHEAKTNLIKIGQEVNVEIEGIPDRIFTGKISKIAPLADSQNRWLNPNLKEYETEITLDKTDANLKPGVTARAEIIVSRLEDVVAVPLQAVFSKGGRHYVFKPNGHAGEPVQVSLGQSSSDYVEVTKGLTANSKVLLAASDDAKLLLPDLPPLQTELTKTKTVAASPAASKKMRRGAGKRGGSAHSRTSRGSHQKKRS